MGEPGMSFFWRQLGYQIPTLLAYLVGVVLALFFFRRATGPALLCLLGCGLLILTGVAVAVIQAVLLQQQMEEGRPAAQTGRAMNVVAVAGSITRAVGFGLVLAGVFVGRRRAALPPGGPMELD